MIKAKQDKRRETKDEGRGMGNTNPQRIIKG